MLELLNNVYFVSCAMPAIVFLVTQVLKMPIKHFTSKIENATVRKRVNAVILILPFALGVLFDYLYSTYVTQTAFTVIAGLSYGAGGISFYNVIERTFKVKIPNPYDTEEGKAVIQLAEAVLEDGRVDEQDADAVKSFLDKVK